MYFLFRSSSLADVAHRCLGGTAFLQEYFFQPIELPVAAFAFGIIDCSDKIGHDSFLDAFPRSHQVAEGNDAEVVAHRCAQQGGCLLKGTDAGQGYDFDRAAPFALHFVDERCHAIDACIARTDDAYRLSLLSQFESLFGPHAFAFHPCVDAGCFRMQVRSDKLKIVFVAYHGICFVQCSLDGRGDVLLVARSDAGNDYFRLFHFFGFHNLWQRYVFSVNFPVVTAVFIAGGSVLSQSFPAA